MTNSEWPIVDVIIPAYNEADSISKVLHDIPSFVREVVVVNNNSTDDTEKNALNAGATVVEEKRQGYGAACLKGIAQVRRSSPLPEIIVFLDADYSDHPEELPLLLEPIVTKKAQMVIGSRALGQREKGSMMPQQIFGNWLATRLMSLIHGVSYSDLGPFRAITFDSLERLGMCDKNYGWTIEMQIKAAKKKLTFAEVPVTYRKRIGVSKVSGTIKGTIMAGYKIIGTIFRYI